jgi:hypothetical protein
MPEECAKKTQIKICMTTLMILGLSIVDFAQESYSNEDCLTDGKPDPEKIDPLIHNLCYGGGRESRKVRASDS